MKLSASKAAKEVGVSVPTITRAIKSGKISAQPVEGGGWLIDPAELFRAFTPVTANGNDTPSKLGHETPNVTGVLEVQVQMLREQIALMERALADRDEVIADTRLDRDKWRDAHTRHLLEGPKTAPAPERERVRLPWPLSLFSAAR